MGALRGLDVDDIDFGDGYVQFRHRPEQDTPLKNGTDGERLAGISDDVVAALQAYIPDGGARPEVTDDYGRKPLFTSAQGRLATSTLRNISYLTTVPCRAGSCPHGKSVKKCEWTGQKTAMKCPSSRPPHQIRPGSITWQLNSGIRADVVAERVNASVGIIEEHYDQADPVEEFHQRRAEKFDKLEFTEENQRTTGQRGV